MKTFVIVPDPGYLAESDVAISSIGGNIPESLDREVFGESLDSDFIPHHPLGVKPSGNQYTTNINSRDQIGPVFKLFPDEILALFLEYLDAKQLLILGSSCKFLHAFCRSDDLWKSLFIE